MCASVMSVCQAVQALTFGWSRHTQVHGLVIDTRRFGNRLPDLSATSGPLGDQNIDARSGSV